MGTVLFKATTSINTLSHQTPEIREEVHITYQEVEKAIKSQKKRKSPGRDGIPNELLKYGRENLMEELTKLIGKIIVQREISDAWELVQ